MIDFFSKLRKTLSFLKHKKRFVNCDSYYPECEKKTSLQVIKDQLYLIWHKGDLEPFYYTYGFDRKQMTRERMEEYIIPYSHFQSRIKQINISGFLTGLFITADKFYYNIFLERFGIPTPRIFLFTKNRQALYVDPKFAVNTTLSVDAQLNQLFSHEMDAFAKPYNGELGKGCFSLQINKGIVFIDGKESSVDDLISLILSANYLIQERIYQHPKMAELNGSSLNTIRLQTVRGKDGVVHPFGAGLRIGRLGNTIDNWAKGGIFVGIDMEKGTLLDRGFMKPQFGTSVKEHPDSHVVFNGFEIPFYKEAEAMAVKLHSFLYRSHSVGWDIAITEHGPVFIEGNSLWEISLVQAVHGGLKKEIGHYFE
jgi:hypothetical protein